MSFGPVTAALSAKDRWAFGKSPIPSLRHVDIEAAELEIFVVCNSQRHLVTAASANDATIDFVGHCSFRRQKLALLGLNSGGSDV